MTEELEHVLAIFTGTCINKEVLGTDFSQLGLYTEGFQMNFLFSRKLLITRIHVCSNICIIPKCVLQVQEQGVD